MGLNTCKPRGGKTYFYEIWPPRNNLRCLVNFQILEKTAQTIIKVHTEEIHIILSAFIEVCYGLVIEDFQRDLGTNLQTCEKMFQELKQFYYQLPFEKTHRLSCADLRLLEKILKRVWHHYGWDHPALPLCMDCTPEDFFDVVVSLEEWVGQLEMT